MSARGSIDIPANAPLIASEPYYKANSSSSARLSSAVPLRPPKDRRLPGPPRYPSFLPSVFLPSIPRTSWRPLVCAIPSPSTHQLPTASALPALARHRLGFRGPSSAVVCGRLRTSEDPGCAGASRLRGPRRDSRPGAPTTPDGLMHEAAA